MEKSRVRPGSLRLRFVSWAMLVLQHPQLLPNNCCCPHYPGWALRGGLQRMYTPERRVVKMPSLMLMFWVPHSDPSHSPALQRSFGFSEIRLQWFSSLDLMKERF